MKLFAVFLIPIFLTPTYSWSAPGKVKILNKYQLKKMGKHEKEYYLKRLVQIFSSFERIENKRMKNKFASNNLNYNFSIFEKAYAAEPYNSNKNCIVGGRVVVKNKETQKCSLSKYKNKCTPKSGERESGMSYYSCGPIYGSLCVVYQNDDISSACARHFSLGIEKSENYDSTLRAAKALYQEICRPADSSSDGCNYLYESLEKLNEVADVMQPEAYVNKDCPTGQKNKSNTCTYCYSYMAKVVRGRGEPVDEEKRVCHDYKDLVERYKILPQDIKDLTDMLGLGLTTNKLGQKASSIKDAIKDLRQGNDCNEFVNKRSVISKRHVEDKKTLSSLKNFIDNKNVCKNSNNTGDPQQYGGSN